MIKKESIRWIGIAVAVMLVSSVLAYQTGISSAQVSPSTVATMNQWAMIKQCDHQIFTDGTTYYSQSCDTGAISFSGTDARLVIENTIDSMDQGVILLKDSSTPYDLNQRIRLYLASGNITLKGESRDGVVLRASDSFITTVILALSPTLLSTPLEGVTIEHLTLDGNEKELDAIFGAASEVTIRDVRIIDTGDYGFHPHIDDFYIEDLVIEGGDTFDKNLVDGQLRNGVINHMKVSGGPNGNSRFWMNAWKDVVIIDLEVHDAPDTFTAIGMEGATENILFINAIVTNNSKGVTITNDAGNNNIKNINFYGGRFEGNTDDVNINNSLANVTFYSVQGINKAAHSSITPGASPYTYTNNDSIPEQIAITNGTVTRIDIIRGASTIFTGETAGLFYLLPGDALKVTYSGTPTMTKIPM